MLENNAIREAVKRELQDGDYHNWAGGLYAKSDRGPVHERLYEQKTTHEPPAVVEDTEVSHQFRPVLNDRSRQLANRQNIRNQDVVTRLTKQKPRVVVQEGVAPEPYKAKSNVWERLGNTEIHNFRQQAKEKSPSFQPQISEPSDRSKGSVFDRLYPGSRKDFHEVAPPAQREPSARTELIEVEVCGSSELAAVTSLPAEEEIVVFGEQSIDPVCQEVFVNVSIDEGIHPVHEGSPPVYEGIARLAETPVAFAASPAGPPVARSVSRAPSSEAHQLDCELSPLMISVLGGNADDVDAQLTTGCSANEAHPVTRRTALHLAALLRLPACMRSLLAVPGIDVNVRDCDGLTPLMLASGANNHGLPSFTSVQTPQGCVVGVTSHSHVLLPQRLVVADGNVLDTFRLSRSGINKVVDAIVTSVPSAIDISRIYVDDEGVQPVEDIDGKNMVSVLLGYGAKVDIQDNEGRTAIHHAIRGSWKDKVSLLRTSCGEGGFQSIPSDKKGRSLLHYCCLYNQPEILPLIACEISEGNAKDSCGVTPFMYASQHHDRHCATALLNTTSSDGTFPHNWEQHTSLAFLVLSCLYSLFLSPVATVGTLLVAEGKLCLALTDHSRARMGAQKRVSYSLFGITSCIHIGVFVLSTILAAVELGPGTVKGLVAILMLCYSIPFGVVLWCSKGDECSVAIELEHGVLPHVIGRWWLLLCVVCSSADLWVASMADPFLLVFSGSKVGSFVVAALLIGISLAYSGFLSLGAAYREKVPLGHFHRQVWNKLLFTTTYTLFPFITYAMLSPLGSCVKEASCSEAGIAPRVILGTMLMFAFTVSVIYGARQGCLGVHLHMTDALQTLIVAGFAVTSSGLVVQIFAILTTSTGALWWFRAKGHTRAFGFPHLSMLWVSFMLLVNEAAGNTTAARATTILLFAGMALLVTVAAYPSLRHCWFALVGVDVINKSTDTIPQEKSTCQPSSQQNLQDEPQGLRDHQGHHNSQEYQQEQHGFQHDQLQPVQNQPLRQYIHHTQHSFQHQPQHQRYQHQAQSINLLQHQQRNNRRRSGTAEILMPTLSNPLSNMSVSQRPTEIQRQMSEREVMQQSFPAY